MLLPVLLGLLAALLTWALTRTPSPHRPSAIEHRTSPFGHRTLPLLVALATAAATSNFLERAPHTWNSVRTAIPIALTRGLPIYNTPPTATTPGTGPLWCNIYPPLAHLLYTPVALASTPAGAIAIGQALSVLFLLSAIAALTLTLAPKEHRTQSLILALALYLSATAAKPLCDVTFMVHVDAPALALGLLALTATLRTRGPLLAGALAASAVMCKQTMLPLVLVLAVHLFLQPSPTKVKQLFKLAASFALTLTALITTALAYFGQAPLLYSTITLPSKHQIAFDGLNLSALLSSIPEFLLLPLALAVYALIRARKQGTPWHQIPALPLLLAGMAELPLAAAAYLKIGGAENNWAYPTFFWFAAAITIAIPPLSPIGHRPSATGHRLLLPLSLLASLTALYLRPPPTTPNQHTTAYALLRAHPGQYYFYWLPLSHLLAENRQTHQSWGLMDQLLAQQTPDPAWLRQYLPPSPLFLAATDPTTNYDAAYEAFKGDFPQKVSLPELPHWNTFARPLAPPPSNP